MAAGSPSLSNATSGIPALMPQGQHTGKPSMPMGRPFTLVGSRHRAHLHLLSRTVSKSHAVIVNDKGNLYIRDTASREHVYINGHVVKESELRDGDLVRIGSFTFKFADGSGKSGKALISRPAAGALQIPGESIPVFFEGRTLLIGRRPTCDVLLSEMSVSQIHALIFELDGRHFIRDMGSRTGTFINGHQIHQQELKFGDEVRVGDHEMRFTQAAASSSTDIDELEHLIGTATLGSEQITLANADAARAAGETHVTAPDDLIPLAEPDDLIPLMPNEPAVVDEPSPAAAPASEPPIDLAEFDLDADPDVSGAGDTRAIPVEASADTPRLPVLSSQVEDEPFAVDEAGVQSEERQLLVGPDLQEDATITPGGVVHKDDEEPNADADVDLMALFAEAVVDAEAASAKEPQATAAPDFVATSADEPIALALEPAEEEHVEPVAVELAPQPDAVTASTHEAVESPAAEPVAEDHDLLPLDFDIVDDSALSADALEELPEIPFDEPDAPISHEAIAPHVIEVSEPLPAAEEHVVAHAPVVMEPAKPLPVHEQAIAELAPSESAIASDEPVHFEHIEPAPLVEAPVPLELIAPAVIEIAEPLPVHEHVVPETPPLESIVHEPATIEHVEPVPVIEEPSQLESIAPAVAEALPVHEQVIEESTPLEPVAVSLEPVHIEHVEPAPALEEPMPLELIEPAAVEHFETLPVDEAPIGEAIAVEPAAAHEPIHIERVEPATVAITAPEVVESLAAIEESAIPQTHPGESSPLPDHVTALTSDVLESLGAEPVVAHEEPAVAEPIVFVSPVVSDIAAHAEEKLEPTPAVAVEPPAAAEAGEPEMTAIAQAVQEPASASEPIAEAPPAVEAAPVEHVDDTPAILEQQPAAPEVVFSGEIPPPFPAGMTSVVASGAVGLPGWSPDETLPLRKPVADEPREVLDHTEPTLESAQHLLDVQIGDMWAQTYAELMPDIEDLSDSKFGLVMQDFAGPTAGHLVEEREESLVPREPARAPAEHAVTANVDVISLEPEPHILESVDASSHAPEPAVHAGELPAAPIDDLVATEGFLPDAGRDELVEQASAFLDQDAVPAEIVPPSMPAEAPAPIEDAVHHEPAPAIEPELEFDDPTIEEMFSPVAMTSAESVETAHEQPALPLDELIAEEPSSEAVSKQPDALTTAETLPPISSPEAPAADVAHATEQPLGEAGDMLPPEGWVPPVHPTSPPAEEPGLAIQSQGSAQSAPPVPATEPSAPAGPMSMGTLLGLSRDFGSFLGGTPLAAPRGGPQVAPKPPAMPVPPPLPAAAISAPRPPARSAIPKPPPLPSAKSKAPSVFGDTPVSSLFKDGVPQFRQVETPNPGPPPAAAEQAPIAPVAVASAPVAPAPAPAMSSAPDRDSWTVVPHPGARENETFVPAPASNFTVAPAPAADIAVTAPVIAEEELEVLPEVPEFELEMLPEIEPEPALSASAPEAPAHDAFDALLADELHPDSEAVPELELEPESQTQTAVEPAAEHETENNFTAPVQTDPVAPLVALPEITDEEDFGLIFEPEIETPAVAHVEPSAAAHGLEFLAETEPHVSSTSAAAIDPLDIPDFGLEFEPEESASAPAHVEHDAELIEPKAELSALPPLEEPEMYAAAEAVAGLSEPAHDPDVAAHESHEPATPIELEAHETQEPAAPVELEAYETHEPAVPIELDALPEFHEPGVHAEIAAPVEPTESTHAVTANMHDTSVDDAIFALDETPEFTASEAPAAAPHVEPVHEPAAEAHAVTAHADEVIEDLWPDMEVLPDLGDLDELENAAPAQEVAAEMHDTSAELAPHDVEALPELAVEHEPGVHPEIELPHAVTADAHHHDVHAEPAPLDLEALPLLGSAEEVEKFPEVEPSGHEITASAHDAIPADEPFELEAMPEQTAAHDPHDATAEPAHALTSDTHETIAEHTPFDLEPLPEFAAVEEPAALPDIEPAVESHEPAHALTSDVREPIAEHAPFDLKALPEIAAIEEPAALSEIERAGESVEAMHAVTSDAHNTQPEPAPFEFDELPEISEFEEPADPHEIAPLHVPVETAHEPAADAQVTNVEHEPLDVEAMPAIAAGHEHNILSEVESTHELTSGVHEIAAEHEPLELEELPDIAEIESPAMESVETGHELHASVHETTSEHEQFDLGTLPEIAAAEEATAIPAAAEAPAADEPHQALTGNVFDLNADHEPLHLDELPAIKPEAQTAHEEQHTTNDAHDGLDFELPDDAGVPLEFDELSEATSRHEMNALLDEVPAHEEHATEIASLHELSAPEDLGLEFDDELPAADEAHEPVSGLTAPVIDEAPAELFDTAPQALDELPEAMADISDVTEAVGETPAPPVALPPVIVPTPPAQNRAVLPATVEREHEAKDKQTLAPRSMRMTPPPPARSIRRSPGGSGMGMPALGLVNPNMPSADVFSQADPFSADGFSSVEIPPTAFIPPSADNAHRPRTNGARTPASRKSIEGPAAPVRKPPAKQEDSNIAPRDVNESTPLSPAGENVFAAPGKTASTAIVPANGGSLVADPARKKGPRKPAVVETIYGAEEDGVEQGAFADIDEPRTRTQAARNALLPAPGRQKRKKWRFPFLGLLALTAAAGGGAAGVWYYLPVNADVRAAMLFDKLDQLTGMDRASFLQAQQAALLNPDFNKQAQKAYETAFHGQSDDSFLYRPADEFPKIIADARAEGNKLVLERKGSHDPDGDRVRMQAVLKALYAANAAMVASAQGHDAALATERHDFETIDQKLALLQKRIDDGQKRQADFEIARKNEKDLSDQSAKLEKAWSDASTATRRARAELDALEAAERPPESNPATDAQLQAMSQDLKKLNDSLTAARASHGGDTRAASDALTAAMTKYQAEIDKVKAAAGDASPLMGYLAVADQVSAALHQIDAEMTERQKTSQQTIADLNRQLSDKIESHLKRSWDSDADLKKYAQDLAVQQHRLGAVSSAGLEDEAAKIRVQVDILSKAVAARREQLSAPALYTQDIKALQLWIANQTDQMHGDQARAEKRMSEQFGLLSAAAPDPKILSADQQKMMDGLVDQLAAVATARKALNQAAVPGGGADVKALEAQTTELAARIEARRRQLADASKNAADSPALVQQRATFAAAQQADANAFIQWAGAKNKLAAAQITFDKLQSNQPDLVRDNAELAATQAHRDELRTRIEHDAAAIPVLPVEPASNAVQIMGVRDNRLYAEYGIAGLFAIASLMMIVRSRGKAQTAPDEDYQHDSQGDHPDMDEHPLTA